MADLLRVPEKSLEMQLRENDRLALHPVRPFDYRRWLADTIKRLKTANFASREDAK